MDIVLKEHAYMQNFLFSGHKISIISRLSKHLLQKAHFAEREEISRLRCF